MGPNEGVFELQNKMSNFSNAWQFEHNKIVLIGPICFPNYTFSPNTKLFLGYTCSLLPQNKCVLLQVIEFIGINEEIIELWIKQPQRRQFLMWMPTFIQTTLQVSRDLVHTLSVIFRQK